MAWHEVRYNKTEKKNYLPYARQVTTVTFCSSPLKASLVFRLLFLASRTRPRSFPRGNNSTNLLLHWHNTRYICSTDQY